MLRPKRPLQAGGRRHSLSSERITAFSDGVFAIAATLLTFTIKLPFHRNLPAGKVLDLLLQERDQLISYALGFVVIGLFWVGHYHVFHFIRHSTSTLIWLNIAFLMCVSLMPLLTTMLTDYGYAQPTIAVYAASVALPGLLLAGIWRYAVHRRLVDEDLDPHLIRYFMIRTLMTPVVFLLSIGVSFWSVFMARNFWWLALIGFLIQARVYRKQEAETERLEMDEQA